VFKCVVRQHHHIRIVLLLIGGRDECSSKNCGNENEKCSFKSLHDCIIEEGLAGYNACSVAGAAKQSIEEAAKRLAAVRFDAQTSLARVFVGQTLLEGSASSLYVFTTRRRILFSSMVSLQS
jgi:hypothetical protein